MPLHGPDFGGRSSQGLGWIVIRRNLLALSALVVLLAFGWASPTAATAYQKGQTSEASGTAARRPPRTFDVEHYIIRTRFDRAKRMVFGDVSISLKPLDDAIDSFELDSGNLKIESVVLESSGKALLWRSTSNRLNIRLPRSFDQ